MRAHKKINVKQEVLILITRGLYCRLWAGHSAWWFQSSRSIPHVVANDFPIVQMSKLRLRNVPNCKLPMNPYDLNPESELLLCPISYVTVSYLDSTYFCLSRIHHEPQTLTPSSPSSPEVDPARSKSLSSLQQRKLQGKLRGTWCLGFTLGAGWDTRQELSLRNGASLLWHFSILFGKISCLVSLGFLGFSGLSHFA